MDTLEAIFTRNAAKTGNDVFNDGAPVLIVTTNKKGYGNAIVDSACALEI